MFIYFNIQFSYSIIDTFEDHLILKWNLNDKRAQVLCKNALGQKDVKNVVFQFFFDQSHIFFTLVEIVTILTMIFMLFLTCRQWI